MVRSVRSAIAALMGLLSISCASPAQKPLVDPFPLRLPLVEAGSLDVDGRVAGQPRARDGIVYYATTDGRLTAVVVPSRTVLWRKTVGEAGPDPGRASGPSASSPVPALAVEGSLLRARDAAGRELWTFAAAGAISSGPDVHGPRVYLGTRERWFYALRARDGRKIWSRRLQGAPIHPAVVEGGSVVVAAANSVVYRLAAKGGSILSWEAVPSRVLYPPALAGSLVLFGSAGPDLVALDIETGRRAGQYEVPGVLAAGPVWSPPDVVLFVEDKDSGRQRIVFLRPR